MKNIQILIITPDTISGEILRDGLAGYKCDVVGIASTPSEISKYVSQNAPNVFLTSSKLWSEMSATDLAKLARPIKNIPIVFILDSETGDDLKNLINQKNFNGFIQQPVDFTLAAMMMQLAYDRRVRAKESLTVNRVFSMADIIEKSSTGVYLINESYEMEYANDKLCQMLGMERDEILGRPFTDFLGESKDLVVERFKARHAGEPVPSEYELDIVNKAGETRNVLISTSHIVNDDGVNKSTGHLLDITEQKQVNMELAKLSQAVEQSPVMTIITDSEGIIEYANAEFSKVTGYTTDELIGNNPRILKSGLHDEAFYKDLWDTIKSGKIWSGELTNKMKDGRITWEKASIAPIRDLDQNITHFVALKEDITLHKAEQEIAHKNQQLRDVQYEITSAAIKSDDVSTLYEKIYEYISEIINSSNFFMALLNKEENRIYFPFDKDSFATEIPESIPCDPKISLTARTIINGKTLHLSSQEIMNIKDEGEVIIDGDIPSVWLGIPLIVKNEVIGALVLQEYYGINHYAGEDVKMLELAASQVALTIDRARKDTALRELAEELRNTNDIKELLLDVITHDLKNPAGVIKTITEVLDAESKGDELIRTLKSSSYALIKVIENATVLSQVNVGESISKESIDFVAMLNEVISEYEPQILNARMTLNTDVPDALIIKANPILSEIPKNYLGNAVKYASKGRIIDLILREESGSYVLRVEDRGTPIPEDKREIIFQRFTRLKKKKGTGRGLGLAIVRRIADAHDAQVGVELSPNGGNSFYLKL